MGLHSKIPTQHIKVRINRLQPTAQLQCQLWFKFQKDPTTIFEVAVLAVRKQVLLNIISPQKILVPFLEPRDTNHHHQLYHGLEKSVKVRGRCATHLFKCSAKDHAFLGQLAIPVKQDR